MDKRLNKDGTLSNDTVILFNFKLKPSVSLNDVKVNSAVSADGRSFNCALKGYDGKIRQFHVDLDTEGSQLTGKLTKFVSEARTYVYTPMDFVQELADKYGEGKLTISVNSGKKFHLRQGASERERTDFMDSIDRYLQDRQDMVNLSPVYKDTKRNGLGK